MKTSKLIISLILAASGILSSALTQAEVRLVFGSHAPVAAMPGSHYGAPPTAAPAWQNGHWAGHAGRQVWVPGYWAPAPVAPVYQGPVVYRQAPHHHRHYPHSQGHREYSGSRSW